MPIKGVSEKRRITRGGHLRLGVMRTKFSEKHQREVTYPEKSDHFIADFEDVTNQEVLEALFYQTYRSAEGCKIPGCKCGGTGPRRVTVAFPSEDEGTFFAQWYSCYGKGSGLKCQGDGETAKRIVDGEMVEVECPSPEGCDFAREHGCRKMARLQVFIRGLPVLKIFQINTGSFNSIVNVNSGIDLMRAARRGGSIAGVWFDLTLREQQAQHNGSAVTIYVLDVEIPVSLETLHQLTSVFDAPMALPAPSEARDPYLQPVDGHAEEAVASSQLPVASEEPAGMPVVPVAPSYAALQSRIRAFADQHDVTNSELSAIAKDKFSKPAKELTYQELERYLAVLTNTYAPEIPEGAVPSSQLPVASENKEMPVVHEQPQRVLF